MPELSFNINSMMAMSGFNVAIASNAPAASLASPQTARSGSGLIMTTLTDKAVMLGMVTFVGSIPIVALTLIGGTFADRHDKRAILLVTQVVQIAFAVLVGWLVATGQIRIWHIILVAFFLGIS